MINDKASAVIFKVLNFSQVLDFFHLQDEAKRRIVSEQAKNGLSRPTNQGQEGQSRLYILGDNY